MSDKPKLKLVLKDVKTEPESKPKLKLKIKNEVDDEIKNDEVKPKLKLKIKNDDIKNDEAKNDEAKNTDAKSNFKIKNDTEVKVRGVYDDIDKVKPKKVLFVSKTDDDKRKYKDDRKSNMYQTLSQHEQIYRRPETYIGSMEREKRVEEIFNLETQKLEAAEITSPFSMIHLFQEIATNAADNADDTRRIDPKNLPEDLVKKIKEVGKLEVTIDKRRVKIRNGGMPMLVIPSDGLGGNLIPYNMFGVLNSGSNYLDDQFIRTGSGRNGLGSKGCNIFSTYFRIDIGDPINGQEFTAIWTGNMTELSYMKCTPGYELTKDGKKFAKDEEGNYISKEGKPYKGKPYVQVEYELDFERFDMQEYEDEIFGVFSQRVLFLGMGTKLIVNINGKDYDVRNIRDFAKMRFSDEICKSAIIHYEWPMQGRGKNKQAVLPERFEKMTPAQIEKAIQTPESPDEIPTVELLALDTPDDAAILSSVNGQCTPEDGIHVTESLRAVSSSVLEEINATITRIKSKKKGKKDEKEVKLPQLTIEAVKKHISLIVSCRLPDTTYSTQTKVKLTGLTKGKKLNITIDKKTLDKVSKWQLVAKLYEEMDQKINKALQKTDGKKHRFITPDKGEDANEAGTVNAYKCILYWTEGDSANAYPKWRIANSPGGKDFAGYMPGKGKSLNICKATAVQMIENTEINRLKYYTGIFEGIDVTKEEDRAKMRYGFICISNDADKDGQHILMLRINYIWRKYPSLIQEGMVGFLETPFARALKGTGKKEVCLEVFRNETQLENWLEENKEWFTPDKGGHWIKYYKGLASSRPHDAKQDIESAPVIVVLYDDKTQRSLDIAFDPENADLRKTWIQKWRDTTGVRDIEMMPVSGMENWYFRNITSLCNRNLVEYSKETYIRALPSEDDGLKESQRKALYGALKKWSFGRGRAGSIKTGRIANSTAELTHYHYNEKCLTDTYTRQAQEFTGMNNMSYYTPEGMLGTRHEGGADAGEARYTEIDISDWIQYVYYEEFLDVVKRNKSEGHEIEPSWLPGVIPMHLVNGFRGIATAYSTFGPNHNPHDLIRWIRDRCNGIEIPKPVKPWYIDFKGKIELENVDWTVDDKNIIRTRKDENGDVKVNVTVVKGNKKDEDDSSSESSDESEDIDYDSDESNLSDNEDERAEKRQKRKSKMEDKLIHENTKAKKGGPVMRTYGIFSQKGCRIEITELPVGKWTYTYRKYLERLRSEGKVKNIVDKSKPNSVHLIFDFLVEGKPTHKTLKLVKSEGLGNMVLIDREGFPTKYRNTQEILEKYYNTMIDMFIDLKVLKLKRMKDKIFDNQQRLLFIRSVNDDILIIKKIEDDEVVYAKMDELGIEHKYLDIVTAREFGPNKIRKLEEEIVKYQSDYKKLFKTSPQELWLELLDKLEKHLLKDKICLFAKNSEDNRNDILKVNVVKSEKSEVKKPLKLKMKDENENVTEEKKIILLKKKTPPKVEEDEEEKIVIPIKKKTPPKEEEEAEKKIIKKKPLIEVKNEETDDE